MRALTAGSALNTAAAREDAAIRSLAGSGGLLAIGNIIAASDAGISDENVKIKESETHRKHGLDGLLNAEVEHIDFHSGVTLGRTISAPMQSMLYYFFIS